MSNSRLPTSSSGHSASGGNQQQNVLQQQHSGLSHGQLAQQQLKTASTNGELVNSQQMNKGQPSGAASTSSISNPTEMAVFVTRLPLEIETEDLKTIFGNDCSTIELFRTKTGQKFRSAKIRFSTLESFNLALLKHDSKLCGSNLVVKKWEKSSESTGMQLSIFESN